MQYPYIPNSNEAVRKEMLDFIGAKSVEEIYSFIPDEVRMKKPLDIPAPFTTEQELSKHMNSVLAEDSTCEENISFLGAGCYDHYVPAICDEINGRSEFLTAYSGDTYADHGKCQAFFEFSSMMGELLDLDVISFPTYDGGQAASTALMMSRRINGRSKALVPENMNPNLLSQMTCYCEGMQLIGVKAKENGQMDLEDLKAKLDSDVCRPSSSRTPASSASLKSRARRSASWRTPSARNMSFTPILPPSVSPSRPPITARTFPAARSSPSAST